MSLLDSVQHSQKKSYSSSHPALFPILTVSTHKRGEWSTSFVGSAAAEMTERRVSRQPQEGDSEALYPTLSLSDLALGEKKWSAFFFSGLGDDIVYVGSCR